jgi:hypothetical protein
MTGTGSADLPFTLSLATPQTDLVQSEDGSLNLGQIEYGEVVDVTLDADATDVVLPFEGGDRFDLFVKQGATPKTITWPAVVKWPGGVAPVLTTTPDHGDLISVRRHGSIWIGNHVSADIG